MKLELWILASAVVLILSGCGPNPTEQRLQHFIDRQTAAVVPLMMDANLAYWSASTTGRDEDYNRYSELDFKIRRAFGNPFEFKQLGIWKASGKIKDPLLKRQMDVLLNKTLINQIEPDLLKRIVQLATSAEQRFSTFRGVIDGRETTGNAIDSILASSPDNRLREKAWLASKQAGPVIAEDVVRLVKLRNQAAKRLGFDSFHTLLLKAGEQDVAAVSRIFDEMDGLTEGPYRKLKAEIDSILAAKAGVKAAGLKPWHYHDPFFQETPLVYELDLDRYYADRDVRALAAQFYAGIGLPVDSILAHSDLYERKGKNPHAFSTDIDREGDVRILCNLQNNERWMETILHELGHGATDFYRNRETPFFLREPAHAFTTEGVAMFFGRLSRNADWMKAALGLSDGEASEIRDVTIKYARMKQLIFARWSLVMFNFEKQLYADPDQDLNALWWKLVERYQLVKKPKGRNAPDWAAKIHFVMAPCYYHNYLLGEMFASQVKHALVRNVLNLPVGTETGFAGDKRVGAFFRKNIFEVAMTLPWDDMIAKATGEPLNPKYFVEEFVK
jgi:peptidyl-dipeptidase A